MLLICFLFLLHSCDSISNKTVLLISLDGFRWDYLDLAKEFGCSTPNFDKLKKMGVSLNNSGTTNVFPTQTLPNHFSIVTGDYAETHQVIANSFFDAKVNMSYPNNYAWKYWYKYATTIWTVNQKQGGKSGCYGWPGAEVDPSISCTYTSNNYYDGLTNGDTLDQAVVKVFKWIFNKENPVNLGVLYYPQPDESGHEFGIGPKTYQMVVELDRGIGVLLKYISNAQEMGMDLNVILTADHGMSNTPTDPSLVFTLNRIISQSDYSCFECSLSPFALITPAPGREEHVYQTLKAHNPNLLVYRRAEVPPGYRYSTSHRISPIVAIAVFPYIISDILLLPNRVGQHGYNQNLTLMHPIFIATGDEFKTNYKAESFESVDIFPLMCHLMGLESPPVNGSFARIKHILNEDQHINLIQIKLLFKALLTYISKLFGYAHFNH